MKNLLPLALLVYFASYSYANYWQSPSQSQVEGTFFSSKVNLAQTIPVSLTPFSASIVNVSFPTSLVSDPAYSTTTGVYTAPSNGTYIFTTSVNWQITAVTRAGKLQLNLGFSINGIDPDSGRNVIMAVTNDVLDSNSSPVVTQSTTSVISLLQGETVNVKVAAIIQIPFTSSAKIISGHFDGGRLI